MSAHTAPTAATRGGSVQRRAFGRRLRLPLGIAVVASALVLGTAIPAVAVTPLAIPTALTTTGLTGLRSNATRLPFRISDRVSAAVDVGTGNLTVTTKALTLQGVLGAVPIGNSFNSLDSSAGTGAIASMNARGWTWNLDGAGALSSGANGTVVWTDSSGATWPFTPVSGSTTAYTSPGGISASLTKTSTGWTLVALQSQSVITFDSNGQASKIADRNGNAVTIFFANTTAGTVVSTAGPTTARTAYLNQAGGSSNSSVVTVKQNNSDGTTSRNAQYTTPPNSVLLSDFKDANGKSTGFTYNSSNQLTKITSTTGATTTFSYDASGKVAEVDQANTTAGSPGTSITRLTYPSSTQTLVADPDADPTQAVSADPHITYTIDSNNLVTASTDQWGRPRSKTYNTGTLTTSSSSNGTEKTSYTYGANAGQSQTKTQSPGGASEQAAFGNTGSSQYSPSSTTDSAGNTSTYTYNGAGNQLTSQSPAVAASAKITANSDGTVATATAPGNGTNATTYSYADHQLTGITPPTSTSLGNRALTYDGYGRLRTQSDGRGITTTYSYDLDDRLLTTSFSDTTPTVTNTWDDSGRLTTQASGSGTITNTYDQLGRLTSTANTAGGGTVSYGWDAGSRQVSMTDSRGTTRNNFDTSGILTSTVYPKGTGTATTNFATDSHGRRTDAWLQANSNNSSWAGHQHTSYDATTGRVAEVLAETGSTAPKTVFDTTYSYDAASAGTTCTTTASSGDRNKLQSSTDKTTGQKTVYCYDTGGRLVQVTQIGGTATNANWRYKYDDNGNRTSTETGSTPTTATLSFNAANQITSAGYSYDGAGNLTASPGRTFTYNGAEQMTSATTISGTTSYTYAGAAQNAVLSETTSGGTTIKLTYGRTDAQGNPEITAYTVGSTTGYVEADPVTGQPNMLHTSSDIGCLYIHDGLGNPIALLTDFSTTAYSYTYDPYGLPTLTAGGGGNGAAQNPYMFKDGIQDRATGFVKFGQRWYDPTTGRWTQQDTLDNPLDPTNANRYAYAGDDPINNIDPSGNASGIDNAIHIYVFVNACIDAAIFFAALYGDDVRCFIRDEGGVRNYYIAVNDPSNYDDYA